MTYGQQEILIYRLASYLRKANAELGRGRLSIAYSRKLARGLLKQLTLTDIDRLQELFS